MDGDRPLLPESIGPGESGTGDLELLVRRSDEDVVLFDSDRIAQSLAREAQLDPERARDVAEDVRNFIERVGLRGLNSTMLRELVNARLLEYGLEDAQRAHARLGVPAYDVGRLLLGDAPAGPAPGPEGTGLALAGAIKREYALHAVFSEAVSNAHLVGDINVQDIADIDRPHAVASSIDFLKMYGVALPGGGPASAPAREADELVDHVTQFTAALHGSVAGPVVWDSVNFALAPYLDASRPGPTAAAARRLLYGLAGAAWGGRPMPCDLHLDWDAPDYMRERRAVGPGGELGDVVYGELAERARPMLVALLEAFSAGDARGRAFASPRLVIHVTRRFTEQPAFAEALELASSAVFARGNIVFALDRGVGSSFVGRDGIGDARAVERTESAGWRSSVFQVVALNLPRVAHLAAGDHVRCFEELSRVMEVAAQAHLEKRVFLEKLLSRGDRGPLALVASRVGPKPFLRLAWTTHWVTPVGLDEMTRTLLGAGIAEQPAALEFATRVVGHLRREAERLSNKHKVRFVLSESCAADAPARFARLDVRFFGAAAATASPNGGELAYTPGLKIARRASVSPIERVRTEGELHGFGVVASGSELWVGDDSPSAIEAVDLLVAAFSQTDAAAITFAPTLTSCAACGARGGAAQTTCARCGGSVLETRALVGDRFEVLPRRGEDRPDDVATFLPSGA